MDSLVLALVYGLAGLLLAGLLLEQAHQRGERVPWLLLLGSALLWPLLLGYGLYRLGEGER